jgi:hypothetical protein
MVKNSIRVIFSSVIKIFTIYSLPPPFHITCRFDFV